MSATSTAAPRPTLPFRAVGSPSIWAAYRAERRKLSSQLSTRVLAVLAVVGPIAFAAILDAQSGTPADTLFGVWVHSSGFAVSLVILGFGGTWGFPILVGILAGDVFSSEDRYETWKTVLTRSVTRAEMFTGKVLAVGSFAIGLVALAALSSLVAGLVFVGGHSLVGLSGNVLSPGKALGLVALGWVLVIPAVLAFTSIAVLLSVLTRNGIAGVIGPVLIALVMQLLGLVGSGVWVHTLLVASAFDIWHPLFTAHHFFGPLVIGCVVSVAWIAGCLALSWHVLRRRDFAGTPVSRRPGWTTALRVVAGTAVVIAVLAIASSWGPAGITAPRLKASITPTFNDLTLFQQRLLGRIVAPGTKLNVLTNCTRRATAPRGPGDWVCTLDVFIPQPGAVPFQQTPVTYDVSVQPNGCYKAESPPSFVGQQTMRDAQGRNVVNPLFTIYGCFNTL